MPSSRPLVRVHVPPGADGPRRLMPALKAALDGSGPAITPIPVAGPTVSSDYVGSLMAAARPDDPDLPLESDDVAVVMATSGSTGAPRGVLLTGSALTSLTDVVNGPGGRPQWVVAIPVTSIGGLNVLVRALPTGSDPVVVASVGGAEPFTAAVFHTAITTAAARSDDVRVSLVPAQLARLLSEDAGVEALRACRQILVGGAALRPELRASAVERDVQVTTTYGGTETAGGCVYDGMPLPGVRVRISGEPNGRSQPQDVTDSNHWAHGGVLVVSGPNVASGYRGEPGLTAERFTSRGFVTSDIGMVAADGVVTVIGRADDVVIIDGVNVSPAAVEMCVEAVAGVRAAAVVVRDVGTPRLWAFVEADDDDADDLDARVRGTVADRLGRPARPHTVRRVARLPHLPSGKIDRMLLREWATTDEAVD